jgi:uncharacterized repeat protein (TIGR01451 family)
MESRASTRTRLSVLPVFIALLFNVVLVAPIAPVLSDSTVALTGSTFNAVDGNLTDDGAESDWCTPAPNRDVENDTASGSTDTSFSSSNNKEDTDVPTLGLGTIPNNKDDLLREYIASETVNGDLFVYLAWVRADSTGTSTIDFEFNQSDQVSSNGVTKVRTDGDLLVTFDFQANPGSQGGYSVDLEVRTWSSSSADQPDPTSTPANTGKWSAPVDLIASGLAEGSVNSGDVSDCVAGGTLATGTFGEAALNLTDILGGDCKAFGSLFTKSRSSNSFSADLKDRIDPVPVNFSTCGQITILKQDENQQPLGGASFSVTPNPFTLTGSLSVTDNAAPDDNAVDGTIHLSDVEPGEYTVCETAAPAGYIIDSTCHLMTVAVNGSATFGPFINGLGDISWTKVDAQSDKQLCCATFTLVGTAGAAIGFSRTVTDNALNDEDPDAGELLVTDLKLGTYRITETAAPAGYDLPVPAFQDVILAGQTAAAANAFEDPPRADASISKQAVVDPIVAGEAASFTVTVTAGGTGDSEEVVLSDLNDTGHDWTISGTDAGACADTTVADGQTLTCDFGTVANGESRTITITMTSEADDCELGIANTATVSSSNDHDASNNEASDSITVLCPNPGVTKEAVADPIVFGEDATFTVTVHAGGTGPAENVVLSDLNDTGHDWTISGTDAGACADTTVADGETLTCTWASIGAGQSRTITITMTSGAGDCELGIENTAAITADADVDTSNNEASDNIEVLCPDPSVLKTADVDPIVAGEPASFDIVVSAGGSGDSHEVVLSDLNETDHTWDVSGADAADCADLEIDPGETLLCDFGTIPNPGSRTITITMTSDADDCALGIENTASISADADVDTSNNTSSDSIEVQCPDLELDKDGSDPVTAGDDVSYTLTVTNHGEGAATNVVLTDELPGIGLGTWAITATENIDEEDCSIVGDLLTCSLDSALASGDWFSVTVTATTDAGACPSIENDGSVSAANEPADDQYANEDSYTITVDCPDLVVIKEQVDENGEPLSEPVSAGEDAHFAIHVINLGPGVAYDVEVVDLAPDGTMWTVIDDGGFDCPTEIGEAGGTCTADELGLGTFTILLSYATSVTDCGQLLNEVSVSASNEPAAWVTSENSDTATIIVECPGLNVLKRQVDENGEPTNDPILAGETASFEILVWNSDDEGIGTAFDVVLTEDAGDLPDGVSWSIEAPDGVACASSVSTDGPQSFSCQLGDLEPGDEVSIIVSGETDRADCGALVNTARVDASNNDDEVPPATATILVSCPEISLDKANDAVDSVLPGTTVSYSLMLTVSDEGLENGEATDVTVVDELPIGLEDPANISDGGTFDPATRTITWLLGTLGEGTYELTYDAVVADDVEHGEELVNAAAATSTNSQCPDLETLGPECEDTSTVVVRVPTLVIDKAADAELITLSGPADALVATPSVVTWTLTYALTNGPVTNAVITDEVPVGFVFLDAANGGTEAGGVVTWNLGTLTESGSVTFRTTVDVATISRVDPTVNTAVIDSAETEPDDGVDRVTVVVEPPPLGGTPTPKPSMPNTATGIGIGGETVTVPVELLVAFFIGSLGALALANVKTRSRRR